MTYALYSRCVHHQSISKSLREQYSKISRINMRNLLIFFTLAVVGVYSVKNSTFFEKNICLVCYKINKTQYCLLFYLSIHKYCNYKNVILKVSIATDTKVINLNLIKFVRTNLFNLPKLNRAIAFIIISFVILLYVWTY